MDNAGSVACPEAIEQSQQNLIVMPELGDIGLATGKGVQMLYLSYAVTDWGPYHSTQCPSLPWLPGGTALTAG
jgi:hypothetical protein